MARKRKVANCGGYHVDLCGENLKAVNIKQAEANHLTDKSYGVNKIIDEWREQNKK